MTANYFYCFNQQNRRASCPQCGCGGRVLQGGNPVLVIVEWSLTYNGANKGFKNRIRFIALHRRRDFDAIMTPFGESLGAP